MGTQQAVALGHHAHVGLRLGPVADQVRLFEHLGHRLVLLCEPGQRDLFAVHQLAALAHRAKTPGLDALGEGGVLVVGLAHADPRTRLRGQGHPLEEQALVRLQGKVAEADATLGAYPRLNLGHVGVDGVEPERSCHRDAMVPVAHEVHLADAVRVYGRHGLATAVGGGNPLPTRAHPARDGPEGAVELPSAVHRPDDRVQLDRLEAEAALTEAAQGLDHLLEGQNHEDVARLAPQAAREPCEGALPAGPAEVELRIGARKPRVARHPCPR